MTVLTKLFGEFEIVPPGPGEPGFPGRPAVPAYCYFSDIWICKYVWYPPDPDGPGLPTPGGGYDGGNGQGYWNWECAFAGEEVCVPEQPALPSVPFSGLGDVVSDQIYNRGWNSHSRSIGSISKGQYIEFKLSNSTAAAWICLGLRGEDAVRPFQHLHTIYSNITGAKVVEQNSDEATLESLMSNATTYRIYRDYDNNIFYQVTKANGDVSSYYSSLPPKTTSLPLYVYAWLWQAGDSVTSASINSGVILSASATVSGSGSVSGYAGQTVTISGVGSVVEHGAFVNGSGSVNVVSNQAKASVGGTGLVEALSEFYTSGYGEIAALTSKGSDHAFGEGVGNIAALSSFAEDYGTFTPPDPQGGVNFMTPMASSAVMNTVSIMTGSANIAALISKGGSFLYGEAPNQEIAALTSRATYPYPIVPMFSVGLLNGTISAVNDTILVFTSTGILSSTVTGDRELIQQMLSNLTATGTFTIFGEFGVNIVSDGILLSRNNQVVGSNAALDESGRVWCVNMETGASSQYEQYGFNSFVEGEDGYFYGLADDGWYKLDGGDDIGADISALLDLGKSDYGSIKSKMIDNVYAGVASDGKLILKVTVDDGSEYLYEMMSSSTSMGTHRFELGQGLEGTYWKQVLVNQDGLDFDIADIHFELLISKRKVR